MIKTITSVYGQNMYDLCLMAYRTQDRLVKFCRDNGVNDLNYVPDTPRVFQYDSNLVTDQKTTNYVYATAIGNGVESVGGLSAFSDGFSSAFG